MPPFTGPHLCIYSISTVSIREDLSWSVNQIFGMSGVSPQTTYGVKRIAELNEVFIIRPVLERKMPAMPFCTLRDTVDKLVHTPDIMV